MGGSPPKLRNIAIGVGHVVSNREYICDITSGAAGPAGTGTVFSSLSFPIQPGNSTTFPWLSNIASNYQEYDFEGLLFEFKTLTVEANAGATNSGFLGEVMLATNYDASATPYTTKQQYLNSTMSSNEKPSMTQIHPIECKAELNVNTHLYVNTNPTPPASQDPKLFNLGLFQIASQGCQSANTKLGELWATYEVIFYKPLQGGNTAGNITPTDKFQLTSPNSTNPLGTSQVVVENQIGGTIISSSAGSFNTYQFPPTLLEGSFIVTWYISGSTLASINSTGYAASTLNTLNIEEWWSSPAGPDTSNQATSPNNGVVSSQFQLTTIVTIKPGIVGPAQIIWAPGGTYPGGTTFGDLVVSQINSNVSS